VDRFERAAEMGRLRAGGATLAAIGERFGLSKERARQILAHPPVRPIPAPPPAPPILTDRAVRSLFLGLDYPEMTERLHKAMHRLGVRRLGDVVSVPLPVLRALPGLGPVLLQELAKVCSSHELRLALTTLVWPPHWHSPSGSAHTFAFSGSQEETELLDVGALRRMLDLPALQPESTDASEGKERP
jgi:hypothetical protein